MRITNAGNVGIGTTAPTTKLEVNGTTRMSGGIGFTLTSGSGLDNRGVITFDDTHMYVRATGGQTLDLGAGGTNSLAILTGSGFLGIGVYPTYQLQLSTDSAGKPNGGSWSNSSDARLKTDVRPINDALDKLTQLNGVSFEWVNPQEHGGMSHSGGFIAQDVEKVFPNWVTRINPGAADARLTNGDKVRSLTLPFEFDAYVVNAIKELNSLALKVKDGIAHVGHLIADTTETHVLRADYAILPDGVTTRDRVTGQAYCITVSAGQLQAVTGPCE